MSKPSRIHERGFGNPKYTPEMRRQLASEAGLARVRQKKGHLWTPSEAKAWSIRAYLRSLMRGEVFGKKVKPLVLPPETPPVEENWNEPEDET